MAFQAATNKDGHFCQTASVSSVKDPKSFPDPSCMPLVVSRAQELRMVVVRVYRYRLRVLLRSIYTLQCKA
ncbi:hypothetical protein NQ317_000133 [Molorchus minor]|uniref:Uncharacterized protein n=1 Tax=Molorchus minor TaxID=1323400 RepID=A0ABQ9JVN3_9CUCU|nr:hypothetical protein NQ317_000133 [Molorchus minor]